MSKQPKKGKFKSIFGRKSSGIDIDSEEQKDSPELFFSREVLADISRENSVTHRVRSLKDLGEVVVTKELEENAIEAFLNAVSDLLDASAQLEGRQTALQFLVLLTSSQYAHLGIVRGQLFRIIIEHVVEEDLPIRISLLKVLTDNGKDISYCEQIGGFLVEFMAEALYSSNADEFLLLLVNIVHYNSSFLDKGIISALVCKTCKFCDQIDGDQYIEECLSLLDASVRYGGLPSEGIYPLIVTLCRTVNIEKFSKASWSLMRNLIVTNLGHTAIYNMCKILEDNNNMMNTTLLRGTVFFIGMSIWGYSRVTTLHYSPVHVLPSFNKISLESTNPLVAKEVSLSMQRLVKKFGADQDIITWDVIMDILEVLLKLLENSGMLSECGLLPEIHKTVHAILSNIEQLYTDNKFNGCTKRLFKILASCARDRPEESVETLLGYYEEKITPSNDDWLEVFQMVLEEYYRKETRTVIRVKVINVISSIFFLYSHQYEDDILSLTLNDYLKNISLEKDWEVRLVTSQLLSDMLHTCSASNYPTILAVIESLISVVNSTTEDERESIQDIVIAVDALIKAFKEKLYVTNNNYVVNIFTILFNHVNQHYIHGVNGTTAGIIRKQIFTLLLSVRANEQHYIGLIDSEERVKYSVHVIFKPVHHEETCDYIKIWLVDCDFQKCFDVILKCLKNELDWVVLECVLKHLKWQLQNKNLFVYCQCNMNKLCSALCVLVNDKMYLNNMQNCPPSMGISELRNIIFPILSVIATYHSYLARERKFELVNCIDIGLNTHCAHTCVSCLSICILEMQQVMIRSLPSILVKLSQISATLQLAIPVLEFLSTLKEIPTLYVNFVEEQYMSIFAMALSYTDSYRYSTYIVTLAHQVIADWFTRCRLTYRKGFVTLIAKALKSSTVRNADRDNREGVSKNSKSNSEIKLFHEEMTDVCLDMMARYSFSSHIRPPKRTSVMEYLLAQGTSQAWLVGNMLIKITTCSSIPGHCSACCLATEMVERESSADLSRPTEMPTLHINRKPETVNLHDHIETETKIDKSFCSYEYIDSGEPEARSRNSNCMLDMDENKRSSSFDIHDRHDSAALVTKLTEMLANPDTDMRMFSPSETLLFSRQGSKRAGKYNCTDDNSSDNDEDGNDDESESENEEENMDYLNHACPCQNSLVKHDNNCENPFHPDIKNHNGFSKDQTPEVAGSILHDGDSAKPILSDGGELKASSVLLNGEELTTVQEATDSGHPSQNFLHPKPSCKVSGSYDECRCSCIGWAEVYIRRPTGNVSWIMEIDNRENVSSAFPDLSMHAASMDYLELYKNLSCYKKTIDSRSSGHEPGRSLSRRHSTGSINDFSNDSGMGESRHSSYGLTKLSFVRSLLSSTPVSNGEFDNKIEAKVNKEEVQKRNSSSLAYPTPRCKEVPGYVSDSSIELQNKNSVSPNFIFLQLFYSSINLKENHPIALEQNEVIDRALKILDRIPSFNAHKFGVLYVRKGQSTSEAAILSNQHGSTRYADFVSGLGNVVNLTECNPVDVYTGGLDCRGTDGNFAYVWKDETTQVTFHVATLMPNKEKDNNCISKKMHIGNNFVTIIYDESKRGYAFGSIKGQFNLAEIVIRPLDYHSNLVTVRYKEKSETLDLQPKIITDYNLPILVRQLAIHTNMAVVTELREKKTTNAFSSNWLERLRQIKHVRLKAMTEASSKDTSTFDFTKFT